MLLYTESKVDSNNRKRQDDTSTFLKLCFIVTWLVFCMTVCNLVQESPEFQRHDTMFVCMCKRKKWEGYRLSEAKVRCSYESVSEVARWGRLTRLLEQRVTFLKKKCKICILLLCSQRFLPHKAPNKWTDSLNLCYMRPLGWCGQKLGSRIWTKHCQGRGQGIANLE